MRVYVGCDNLTRPLGSDYAKYSTPSANVKDNISFRNRKVFSEKERVFSRAVYIFINNKDKIIEQHLTEKESAFLSKPDLDTWNKLEDFQRTKLGIDHVMFAEGGSDIGRSCIPTKTQLMKALPQITDSIKDAALQRWVLSLDDATRMSVNLTGFSDVELAGLKYMLATWDIARLKKFKEQLEERKKKFEELKSWKRIE